MNWKENRNNVSSFYTNLEVLLGRHISLEDTDVIHDLILVEEEVLGDGRNESLDVSESFCPGLNGGKVFTHVLAGVEFLWEL